MPLAHWFRPPLRTLTSFIALVGAVACALAWLGWQVIRSDREAEHSRATERLDAAVGRVFAALRQQVTALPNLGPKCRLGQPVA